MPERRLRCWARNGLCVAGTAELAPTGEIGLGACGCWPVPFRHPRSCGLGENGMAGEYPEAQTNLRKYVYKGYGGGYPWND